MSSLSPLGKLAPASGYRDAVHVAIVAVQAPQELSEPLRPGQHVGPSGKPGPDKLDVGIVDPFLETPVMPGEWFWLCLYPNSVTGMVHHWTHPKFAPKEPPADRAAASRAWLEKWAADYRLSYHELLGQIESGSVCTWGESGAQYSMEERGELLSHYAAVTGSHKDLHEVSFSCGC